MKKASPLIAALILILHSPSLLQAEKPVELKLESVQKIWDQDPHNAFTGLTRFKDQWFCVFRTGKAHVSPDGALQVLSSTDGKRGSPSPALHRTPPTCAMPKSRSLPRDSSC